MDIQWPSQNELEELNGVFGFDATGEEQDWGVEFANENRTEEFFLCYESQSFSKSQKMAVMQLVLASFDELIYSGKDNEELWQRISRSLVKDAPIHKYTIEYWCCDGESNENNMFSTTSRMRAVSKAL